jgi:superfamily II RNA helicase
MGRAAIDRPIALRSERQRTADRRPEKSHSGERMASDSDKGNERVAVKSLVDRLPAHRPEAEELLEIFMTWAAEIGLDLYPAQEEAILELLDGRHVILNTPTGSGKSLVAMSVRSTPPR